VAKMCTNQLEHFILIRFLWS